ncbi:MAG: RNA polymerase sigma factor [Myxococcales bacterium]|nr:RNA polymerase sigma factor [Myxococcales bacterium]
MAPPASSTFRAPPLEGRGAASASTGSVGPADPVAAARAGDMQAWAQLYQENFDRIYRRLCYLVGRSADAEDLTHETFARAVVGLASFDGRSSFSTWLRGIATNVARNFLRDKDTRRRAEERLAELAALAPGGEDGDRTQLRRARTEALYVALAATPEHLREAFVLCEVEGLSMSEAAAEAGVTVNNMTVRAWRARRRVRAELGRMGWLPEEGEA